MLVDLNQAEAHERAQNRAEQRDDPQAPAEPLADPKPATRPTGRCSASTLSSRHGRNVDAAPDALDRVYVPRAGKAGDRLRTVVCVDEPARVTPAPLVTC